MAKEIEIVGIDEAIASVDIPWQPDEAHAYVGRRIEEFLKKELRAKVGYIKVSDEPEADMLRHLRAFMSEDTYRLWLEDSTAHADLLLADIPLPNSGDSGQTSYIVKLENVGEKSITATKRDDLKMKLRFTSVMYNPIDSTTTDTNEDGDLLVQTRMEGAADWVNKGTVRIQSVESGDASAYTLVDISPYISEGTQSVRLQVVGRSSEEKSPYVNISVTLTNVTIRFGTQWQKPFTYSDTMPTMAITTYVTGSVSKMLHLKVASADGSYMETYDYNLGTAIYTETPYTSQVAHPGGHGVYTVEAWITSGEDLKTDSVTMRIMCVMAGATTPLLALNNIGKLQNWSSCVVFDYAAYNPTGTDTDIIFTLSNSDYTEQFYREQVNFVNGSDVRTLQFDLEVETDSTDNFLSRMTFTTPGGVTLLPAMAFLVDNSESFAPTPGADFILNPKVRSNTEADRDTIVNAADGSVVTASFSGVSFVSDGWVQDDNGQRCLRVLDGGSLTISYDAFTEQTASEGLTIEIDFATRNITDDNGHLLEMGLPLSVDGELLGLWLQAKEGCLMTMNKRTKTYQRFGYQQDVRQHVAFNIVPNLYGAGLNYVRVFANQTMAREFAYSDTDSFVQSAGSGGISICPTGGDIDIYGMRVYKKPMSTKNIEADRLSALPTTEEKKANRLRNDIFGEDGTISYAKCYDKYNTILYKGKVPSLKEQANTTGDVVIHKPGDPAHSGTLSNMKRKGQGSTSKKYAKWNVQSDFQAGSTWTDENGVNHGKGYRLNEQQPMATKLCDKRNWASSMQSHKMGATKAYDDLYRIVVGKNEITSTEGLEQARTAVYQEPFLCFKQEDTDAEPVFIGLGTFGAGKGDKATFGYDKTLSPNLLMVEGADNNPRLTKQQVPWIAEDVETVMDGSDVDGWSYAGTTSWDFGIGNVATLPRIIEIFNYIYLHNTRIQHFAGTYAQLKLATELDYSYAYWVTQDGGGGSRYDLYRYEELAGQWVPAGTEKVDGAYSTLNVKTQTADYLTTDFAQNEANTDWEAVTQNFQNARVTMFRKTCENYISKRDIMYMMCFLKIIGASDNRAKNTYLWVFNSTGVLRAWQDDLDSILPTDNQGQENKPYYIEEHDYSEELGKNIWNGEDNNFYNLMEQAFPEELRAMTNEVLTAMAEVSGSVSQFFDDYFFSTCRYFPESAYNEFARIGYEKAHRQMEAGEYNNDTDPITQSLGSQLECESQWVADRIAYISSYACYGEFSSVPSGNNINFRSTEQRVVHYDLTPAMWLYPVITVGQSVMVYGRRIKAGETLSVDLSTDANTQYILCGMDYMKDIGQWHDKPANGALAFTGKRLRELLAGSDDADQIHLKITEAKVNSLRSLRTLDLHGLTTITGEVAADALGRLESIDLRGTTATSVTLPKQEFLTAVRLPASITKIRIEQVPSLSVLDIEGYANIQDVYVNAQGVTGVGWMTILSNMRQYSTNMAKLVLHNISMTNATVSLISWLLDVKATVTGTIAIATSNTVTFELKKRMLDTWGNVDDPKNSIYVTYKQNALTQMAVSGQPFLGEPGQYQYTLKPGSTTYNDFTAITWSISANIFATIDAKTGVVTVNDVGAEEDAPTAIITATATTPGGDITASLEIGLYNRTPQVGDYVYANGAVSPPDKPLDSSSVTGVIFQIKTDATTGKVWKYAVALSDVTSQVWGIYSGSIANVKLADDPDYNVYDLPLPNISSISVETDNSIQTLLDNTLDYGFMKDWQSGDRVPGGMLRTLQIVNHRNKILRDSSVDVTPPKASPGVTERESLTEVISELQTKFGNANYQQYAYPAASIAYAYLPTVKTGETLDERLGLHRWFLPSYGELLTIFKLLADTTTAPLKPAVDAGVLKTVSGWHWSCTEGSSTHAWGINSATNSGNSSKSDSRAVRPVTAFV